jgi:integrase
LFGEVEDEEMKLRLISQKIRSRARAANTTRAYETNWRDFEGWCGSQRLKALPASEATLELYLAAGIKAGKSISTIESRVHAIRDRHKAEGHGDPYSLQLREWMKGARRANAGRRTKAKAALPPEHVLEMARALLRDKSEQAIRDRAVIVLGFALGRRRSELAALDLADVVIAKQGVRVTIRKSKTDQEGQGHTVGVFAGARRASDPVAALQDWLKVRGKAAGPLFTKIGWPEKRLDDRTINLVLKRALQAIGVDPADYGAHSMRAGCVTAAAERGVPESLIMRHTGHKSIEVLQRYVRPAKVFGVDVLAGAL